MYPTDLTETQWQFIKKTLMLDERKRKHSLRSIWNAIHYLVKTGCQWRMLPLSFAKWQLVYYCYCKWAELEMFDMLLTKLRENIRLKMGQNAQVSLGIIDSQSVKWGNNRTLNGYDGNKKVKGIKRHVATDKNGFLLAVMISAAQVHDSKAAVLLMQVLKELLRGIKTIVADGGYRKEIIGQVKNVSDVSYK